jgi:uncharacterized metal-binding protein YceD (DUF177 family)
MKKENTRWSDVYRLNFYGLKDGEHNISFDIEETFFQHFPVDDIFGSRMRVDIILDKTDRHLRMCMTFSGSLEVECDVSLEKFWMEQSFETELIVKFADVTSYEDHEVWTIDRGAHHIDLAGYFYETMVVYMPVKRVNPLVESGETDSPVYRAYLKHLESQENENTEERQQSEDDDIDPRWKALKQLKKDK